MSPLRHGTRGPECLSDFGLERLLGNELPNDRESESRRHLAVCDACRARHDEIVAEREAFAGSHELLAPADRRAGNVARLARARRWVTPAAGALAAAAALIVWSNAGRVEHEVGGTRLKGGSLSFFVARGRDVHDGISGEQLRAGDKVQFVLALPKPSYVAVISRDGRGRATVFFPDGPNAALLEAGPAVQLPNSTVLDDAPGSEFVYSVRCNHAVLLEPMRSKLESTGALSAPDGCVVDSLTWAKEPTP